MAISRGGSARRQGVDELGEDSADTDAPYEAPVLRPAFREQPTGSENKYWRGIRTFSLINLLLALTIGLLIGGATTAVDMGHATVYSSQAALLIDQPTVVLKAPDDGPLRKLSLLRLRYVDLAHTSEIVGPAATRLGISQSAVSSSVGVAAPAGSLLLVVSGHSGDKAAAQRLANSEAGSISSFADREQQQLNVPQADRYHLTVIQPANANTTTKVQPKLDRALKRGAIGGVAAAVIAYIILQLLTTDSRLD